MTFVCFIHDCFLHINIFVDGSFREEHPHRPIQNWSRDPDEQIYNPWGKPGAGAPLKDKDGDIKASLPTHLQRVSKTILVLK